MPFPTPAVDSLRPSVRRFTIQPETAYYLSFATALKLEQRDVLLMFKPLALEEQ